jgi:cellulose synthase/poly-beta-1,6-N-acetylglucosamine synthase-like glycosyltransferase/spore germination protein YaaH/peptidoglycan/xylan/chitin deacetylase (PgdA/CDA1 family)
MENNEKTPVFYDPHNKRWPRIKNTVALLIFTLFFLVIAFIISIYLTPALNKLPLSPVEHLSTIHYHRLNQNNTLHEPKLLLNQWNSLVKNISGKLSVNQKKTHRPLIMGFLVNDDDSSFRSLVKNLHHIDVVIGEFLHLKSADGDFIEDNPAKQKIACDYIKLHKPRTKIIPIINNIVKGDWQSQMIADLLASPQNQDKLITSLLTYVQEHHYDGVNIDFEEVPAKSQKNLTEFIKKITLIFHQNKLSVSIDVSSDVQDTAFNVRKLSNLVDFIVLMLYDEHEDKSNSGPIASLSWFVHALHQRIADIPSSKLVIGLGNYGYDWENNQKKAVEINFQDLMSASDLADAQILFNSSSLNPSFNYLENDTITHSIWFADAATLFNQLSISQSLKPYGYSLWRLGSEDPSIWKILGHKVGSEDIKNLETIQPGYSIYYQGKGEVIDVAKMPQVGTRKITYETKHNLIMGEVYNNYPTSYILNRYGGEDPKKIALTFDDGPDPKYTGQILDILKATHTHATFFVIGSNAMLYPQLLKRELSEGHDIGNHTFTHPNISEISQPHLIAEVAFTERLLETYLGRGSHLFRPPYAEDTEPNSESEVNVIDELTKRKYLIVGMKVDPGDWLKPGVNVIVQNTLTSVDNKDGNIILLHDSGGDRDQTIEALPIIIADLKSRGYHFVTVSELLGLPQSEVMPEATKNLWESTVDLLTFNIMSYGSATISTLFFVCIILGVLRVILLCILAVYQKFNDQEKSHKTLANYSVAVLVPAYNEGKVIIRTIDRLLELEYPKQYQIIAINDGSTDDTLQLLQDHYGTNPLVRIISQENRGKSIALNNAVNLVDADIIVTLDADTLFSKKTIVELTSMFDDPNVGAVAGNIKVGNKINLLTRMQSIEYITSQNLERRAFKILNAITVIPGSVGAWRRSVILAAGGFTNDTLAEDADLTLKIQRLGYTVVYADKATAYTEAPDTVKSFLQQRYRWMFGTFQVAWKHADILFRLRHGYLGFIALPSIFLYQIIYPFIAPLMDLLLVLALVTSVINRIYHPVAFNDTSLLLVLSYYLVFTFIDFLTAVISFLLENKESKKSLILLIPQRFFYRQLIYYVAIKTIISSLRGKPVGWNKIIRKATVNEEPS